MTTAEEKTYVFSKDFPGLGGLVTSGSFVPTATVGLLAAPVPEVIPAPPAPLVDPSAKLATTLSNVIFFTRKPPSTASFSASILGLGTLGREGAGTGPPGTDVLLAGLGGGTTVADLEVAEVEGGGRGDGLFADMADENASLSANLAAFGIDCFTLAAPGLADETLSLDVMAFISY